MITRFARSGFFWPVLGFMFMAVVLAAGARADTTDDSYLAEINAAGITYTSPQWIENLGKGICQDLRAGVTPADEANAVLAFNTKQGGDLDIGGVMTIVHAAQHWYCMATQATMAT